ncbi:alpha-amylase, partial [Candidatus Bipolaricaulota bacterium]|nr:alpha-amylase [Candidatus Bipolaricaulota bacterium]
PPMPRDDGAAGEWSRGSIVYNLLVRASCAFDHNGDGRISLLNADGVRETGTFVKAVALLPYIRDLGCNAVHLLPVCRIGQDGRKGELGSPYAIANPYELEDTLAEPLLGLGAETEFKAFVEAAHHLGIRVVLEFVVRTAAKDSEWIAEHPEWFYWIDAGVPDRSSDTPSTGGYGSPTFSADELDRIRTLVAESQFSGLPAPPEAYRALFAVPPRSENVRYENSRFVGITETGRDVRIPGAFADWPPDDPQPPWSDVTYLRLYDHTDFNYVAYNTIRMYDDRLATPSNAVSGLWDRITGIMPHFQNRFAIDGAMIDMGHALPALLKAQVIAGARGVNPTFGFWDEDFQLLKSARRDGYNAAVGNLWWMVHHPERLRRDVFDRLATEGVPIPAFATPETHNTRRCAAREGGVERSLYCWTIGAFLPAIPYIHSGFELGEVRPVNTGLDFTPEEIRRFPPESLPLYSPCEYAWIGDPSLREGIRRVLSIRRDVATLVTDSTPDTFDVPITHGETGVTYVRRDNRQWLLVVGNPTAEALRVRLSGLRIPDGTAIDRIRGRETQIVDGRADLDLAPWECVVFAGELQTDG